MRGTGKNAYVVNSSICGAINGIEMVNADNCYLSNLSLLAYQNGITIKNSANSFISTVLTNVTIGIRNRWYGLTSYKSLFSNGSEKRLEASIKADAKPYSTVHMMMDNLSQVHYIDSKNAILQDCFSYGALHTIDAENSDVTAINIGKDCYWVYKVNTPMINCIESNVTVYNQHRFNGQSFYADDDSSVTIYTRVTIGEDETCFE